MQNKYVEDRKYRYLEMLQGIIARMADCSFKCKEFCLVIVSALLALFATNVGRFFIVLYIAIIPCLVFWVLDSYYLTQERAFRGVYKKKAVLKEDDSEFAVFNFERGKLSFADYRKTFFSKTMWPLYLVLILLLAVGGIVLTINCFCNFLPFINQEPSAQ